MSRWYQNVLSGEQVEVKTLEDDDFYQDNPANWARIAEPPKPEPELKPAVKPMHRKR